jgi:tRNA pseudouridine38-40 synthase
MKTAFIIAYKGTRYAGWQVQDKFPSVQKTLQNAIEDLLGRKVKLSGCSRTDSGVHALEYYCHIDTLAGIENGKLPLALNLRLPDDISVLKALTVDDDFHSRYSSTGKQYVYVIRNSYIKDPFEPDMAYLYKKPLDVNEINRIGAGFVGTHDFRSFMAAHSKITDTVRTVTEFRAEREGDVVKIFVTANGFLYNMVRIMVGTVLDTLSGRIKADIPQILEQKERKAAGRTAPAHGLFLNRVFY